jgi:hypothetical protein
LTIKQIGNEKEARQCKQHRDGPSRFLETDGIGKCGNLYRTNIGKSNGSGKIHYGQIACVGNGLSGKYSCSAYTKNIG